MNTLKNILAASVAIITAILFAFLRGKSSGKDEVETQVKAQDAADTIAVANKQEDNIKVVANVQKEVISSDGASIDKELSDEWTR